MLNIRSLLVLYSAVLFFPVSAYSEDAIQDKIREGMQRSMGAPVGTQSGELGPLLDGRSYIFEVRYHSEGGVVGVSLTGNRSFEILFPRRTLSTVPFVADAMLGCFLEPRICSLMPAYVSTLISARTPSNMRFLDEIHVEFVPLFTSLRYTDLYLQAVAGGIENAITAVNLHEICHVVLGHLEVLDPQKSVLVLEGQADGCMLEVLTIAGLAPVGGLPFIMNSVVGEEALGEFRFEHPSPGCRAIALTAASLDWIVANREAVLESAPEFQMPTNEELREAIIMRSGFRAEDCAEYESAVAHGRSVTRELFSEQTEINTVP